MLATKHGADEKAIRKLDVEWGEAACKGDLNAVVAFYASDGSAVWPDAPAFHGKAKIRAAWKKSFATIKGLSLKFTPERIVVARGADLATDFGKVFYGEDTPKGHVVTIGKYVVVWQKEGGAWKVLYDCYNMNKSG
jgi:ketosteroid isomerase-like protein